MGSKYQYFVEGLNNEQVNIRLNNLKQLQKMIDEGKIDKPKPKENRVNNHIHTTYSFSPYSPTRSVWEAYQAGLTTAGIMDHDSISGAREFIKAGQIIGLATTVGLECRADFSDTRLAGKTINCPDQESIAYMTLHRVPHDNIEKVQKFFKPYREERNKRNRLMVDNLNEFFQSHGIKIDFDEDVIPISEYDDGGTITERHLLFAVAEKLIEQYGKGSKLFEAIKDDFEEVITPKIKSYLIDEDNEYYKYDLLGLLKKDTSYFFIEASSECPDVKEVLKLAEEVGAITAYAYLGDVKESVTGDKKAQKFEDDYLDLLFEVLDNLGFNAVAYMPSRNTMDQLQRLKSYCDDNGFFQISGEDINSPRQSFICEALEKEEFHNLIDSTWALIGHEKAATENIEDGMFTEKTISKYPELEKRIEVFKEIGREK